MPSYVEDRPIVLGLAGEGGTGKTATADALAPVARFNVAPEKDNIWWEPLAAAAPLYEIASILQMTEGEKEFDRKAYGVHRVLVDLFGMPAYGAPSYEELVELVYDFCCMDRPPEGKPRSFLQAAGGRVRELMPDCFPSWLGRRIQSMYAFFRQEQGEVDPMPMFGVVLSDLRMENEIRFVRDTTNGVMIKLTCDFGVRQERLTKRDNGQGMTAEQRQHNTETWVASAPAPEFDAVIDTTSLSLSQQVSKVLEVVEAKLDLELPRGMDNESDLAERPRRIR
jgi:hypothetical protein